MPSNSLGFSYYVEGAPLWTNVASSPIGHEMFHAFDLSGQRYDAQGNTRNWWTKETRQRFKVGIYPVPLQLFHG